MRNKAKTPLILICLFIFGSGLPVLGEPTDEDRIHDAINVEDVNEVKRLIESGVNLDPWSDIMDPPLATAIRQGNLEIIRLLLDNGADPNAVLVRGPGDDISILSLVLYQDDEAILDLFIEYSVSREHFRDFLLESLSSGQHADMVRIVLDKGLTNIDASLPFLLRYAYGNPDVRTLIADYNSDISEGRANLLNEMLKNGGINTNSQSYDPEVKYPLATTFLGDKKDPFLYSEKKAFDGDLKTSWVEGLKGDGIGEKIAFTPLDFIRGMEITSISVVPGYGVEKYFRQNNRVKQAILSVYPTGIYAAQWDMSYHIGDIIYQTTLTFDDDLRFQEFPLEIPGYEEDMVLAGGVLFVLEIKEVYPGSDWDDACIAEIELKDRNGNKISLYPRKR